jgi:hypothetical protein
MDQSDYFQYSRPSTPSTNRRQFQTSSPKPVVTPLPTKTVSLAEWEANTPLNQTELASLAIVKEACGTRPLPAQVCVPFLRRHARSSLTYIIRATAAVTGDGRSRSQHTQVLGNFDLSQRTTSPAPIRKKRLTTRIRTGLHRVIYTINLQRSLPPSSSTNISLTLRLRCSIPRTRCIGHIWRKSQDTRKPVISWIRSSRIRRRW